MEIDEFENDKHVINIDSSITTSVAGQDELMFVVYLEISTFSEKTNKRLKERVILASKNDSVVAINKNILGIFDAYQETYLSSVVDQDEAIHFPVKFLSSLNPPGFLLISLR